MTELEKVIEGLRCCVRDVRCKAIRTCDDCPYDNDGLEKPCQMGLMIDALAMLKKQEERIKFLDKWVAYLEGGDPHEGKGVLSHD